MAMPTFQELMLPTLKFVADGQTRSVKEIIIHMEQIHHMTDSEKQERIPSGLQRTIYNRVTWAISYMKKAGLLELRTKRGYYGITEAGEKLLSENPSEISFSFLRRRFNSQNTANISAQLAEIQLSLPFEHPEETPEEIIGTLSKQLDIQLVEEILDNIYDNTPDFFENLVVDLLLKIGYGGLYGSGKVTKSSGDGGIDGIIEQDELGLDTIYIQAKRWDKGIKVSRPEMQKFYGALGGAGANKGVYITTSTFSEPAIDYAKSVSNDKRIILVDGLALAKLMIKHDLGVSTSNIIRIKKIDSDYFEEQ